MTESPEWLVFSFTYTQGDRLDEICKGLLLTGFFHQWVPALSAEELPSVFGDAVPPTRNVPKYNVRKTNYCLQTPLIPMEFSVNPRRGAWVGGR